MRYYILDKNTRELIRQSQTPFNVDEAVQPPDPYIQLKRTDDQTQPAYDPATQKLVYQFTDNDATFTRNFAWAVVAMTQAEIDAYNQQQQDAATLALIRQAYNDLKNGTGTAGERLQRVERVCAYLLRIEARQQFGG